MTKRKRRKLKKKRILLLILTLIIISTIIYLIIPKTYGYQKKVIEIFKEAFAAPDSSEEIEFDFHGGEIALAFEIIRKSCEWLWKQKWPKKYM